MAAPPLLDTNILVRHLTKANPTLSPRATAYLGRIERGEIVATATDTVVFETVFVLESGCKAPRADIRDRFVPILELASLRYPGKRRI